MSALCGLTKKEKIKGKRFLKGLSDRELERRLDIVQGQIPKAFKKRDTCALDRLREREVLIINERLRRL